MYGNKTIFLVDIGEPRGFRISYRCELGFAGNKWKAVVTEQYPHEEKNRNDDGFSVLLTAELNTRAEENTGALKTLIEYWFSGVYPGMPVYITLLDEPPIKHKIAYLSVEEPLFAEDAFSYSMKEADSSEPEEYITVPVFYGTDRKRTGTGEPGFYGKERGVFETGICQVSVPADHVLGEVERPGWLRKLLLKEDPSRHFTILSLEPWKEDVFYGTLKEISESSAEKDALVFIHGYRVDFSEAAFRTAQIATDIQFRGIPVLYSWPSQGTLAGYFADEDSVKWTVPHLTGFIKDLVNRAGIRKLHLIAHSMGNRALSDALMALKGSLSGVVNQIILTAPDIDSQIFTDIIAPAITSSASRVTLYASSRDKALQASRAIRSDIRRAGEAGESIVVTTGIDTVDASHIDTDTLGHSYFSEAESVINDIFSLIRNDLPPDKRNLRKKVLPEDRVYWAFPRNYR